MRVPAIMCAAALLVDKRKRYFLATLWTRRLVGTPYSEVQRSAPTAARTAAGSKVSDG